MKQIKEILFIISISIFNIGFTQPKHALLIGINKYYKLDSLNNIVLDSHNSLEGCVNDAESIKSLLISRFGFKATDINMLYDSLATQQNILKNIDTLLAQCDTGSIAFVYYSGHGMSIQYGKYDWQKEEVICPADIFLSKKYSCIQNSELAFLFNKFVDKQVTLTSIFDCCFSFGTTELMPNMWNVDRNKNETIAPIISKTMSTGPSDEPDNKKTKQIQIIPTSLFSITTEIDEEFNDEHSSEEEDAALYIEDENSNGIQYRELGYDEYKSIMRDAEPDSTQWGFKYKFYELNPPSLRVGSNFLFMSATNDKQKAIETRDENGFKHGIFTKALLTALKELPSNTNSLDILSNIENQFGKRFYSQTPSWSPSESRRKMTLVGVHPDSVNNFEVAELVSSISDTLLINKGALSGISVGNKIVNLQNPNSIAEIVALYGKDSAKAKQISISRSFSGQQFMVYDWNVKSKPLLRVYLPKEMCTYKKLDSIYNAIIIPLKKNKYFLPFEKADKQCSKIYLKGDGKNITYVDGKTKKTSTHIIQSTEEILDITKNQKFIIFLPVPIHLAKAVQAECQKNQNVVIVNSLKHSDVTFYCAYYKTLNQTESELYKLQNDNFLKTVARNVITDGLVIVGSDETIGKNRYKPGHQYLKEEPYKIIEKNMPGNISRYSSILTKWFNYKASKRGWLVFDEKK